MARWKVTPKSSTTLTGKIEYDNHGSSWSVVQDVQPFLDEAKRDRAEGDGSSHMTKMFSIPEVIAIEIREKWGVDIFAPDFMQDKEKKAKVFQIVEQEYPNLKSTEKTLI